MAKAALLMPFRYVGKMIIAIGLMILVALFAILATVGVALMVGVDKQNLQNMEALFQAGDFSMLLGLSGIAFASLLGALIFVGVLTHIFNHWVRLVTFGPEGAKFASFKAALGATAVNGVKFFLILILTSLISLVVTFVLGQLGLSPSLSEQMAASETANIAEQSASASLSSIIMAIVSCLVYSVFSANLTQTALGSDKEGLDHPHTVDFAIVLFLIYLVVLLPSIAVAYAGLSTLLIVIQFVLGFYVLFAAAAAHGLRYNLCIAENAAQTDTVEGPQ